MRKALLCAVLAAALALGACSDGDDPDEGSARAGGIVMVVDLAR